ncbi:MAG TPA: DUF302 domain-containing protein [Gemmatimonadaceae bacterium]|jgi:uncharacterized protein (DUF302 family)
MNDIRRDTTSGLVSVQSHRSAAETVAAIQRLIETKGIRLFAVIDHAAEARAISLTMPPTVVLIFGDPRVGTPMMLAAPTIAIDLPLKLLVSEDADGVIWISYFAPESLQARHGLPVERAGPLTALEQLVSAVANQTH